MRCGRCGCGVLVAPPRYVFDHFSGENVTSLFIHFAEHYAQMRQASHEHDQALDRWQSEGGP